MKELSKKKYVTLITIMILVLGIIGIVNIGNVDLDKGKVKLKSASIEKLKSSVIESKGYEEITYPVLYELEKVEGIEERNVIIKGTLTKEENKYARFKEITSNNITSTVSENGREIEIKIEKVKLGRQNKINIKIEINGAINETKIKPEIEIKEESEKEYTKVNTEEIEVKTNSVTGLVQDEEGMSVSNLELSINKGNEEIRRTYTDENGRYVFSDVEEGKYIIKVEEENYELKEIKEVEVIGGITENIIVKKIKPYEIEVNKYISKIKLNNNGKEIEYEYGKLNKVNQTVKNLKNLSGEIEYKIEIKNTGEKSGEITKIEEEVTEGLKFSKEKNSEWEEKNGKIINRSLEGIKLKAGEEKEITLKLDIEKTDEARSYLQKVTAKGEVYQNVVYILGGKEYRKEKVLDGETIEEPKIVQENFKGWYTDKKYTNKYNFKNSVTKDIILYGKIEESTKKYTVQYIDEGKIIKEEELEEGSIINAPEVTKEGYTFDGWYEGEEKYDVYEPITRNLILESKYEINKYKVRFINEDGSVLQEETLDYGSTPTYKKETPTKKRTEEYTYEFDKWTPEITKVTSNQEYKATYKETKNKYTVTYINDGEEYHKETAEYGSVITEIQDPIKEGYTFTGWYKKDNEKVTHPITVTKNITLYSKYEVNSYKVSYYNEEKKYIDDQKINYGENALKPNTDPSKIGYTFKYWSLKENGEEYEFSTKITKDIALYAVYEINKYTVTYINEGIEYHKETVEYGSVITSIQDPTKEGYTFTGWYNENNQKVTHPITVTEDITLHSKYEINTYTVSFYHNNEKYVEDQKVNYGESAVKPSTDPTKEDYNFSGWVIKGTNNKYDFTSKVTKNIELESSFTVKPTYTVTYKIGNEVILTENVIEGHKVTSKEAPYKKGYLFDKWYSDEGLTIENNFDEKIMGNKTIYGKYNENKHTVTYINEGTTYYTEEVLDSFTAKGPNTNPSKIGYTFKYFSKDKKVAFDYNSEITEDITLYAVYEINKYTVTYINEGSEYHKEELTYGSKHEKIEDPFKTGYTFIGWYNENEEKVEYPITVTKDITLHSKYEINKYTVTFNDEDRITTKEVNYNAKVEPVTNQGKTGYTFKYWSIEKGGEEYNFNTEITENITLYAVYSINKYTVTFKNYDGSTLQEETLEYGALPKYKGEAPTREKTKEYTYTFKGWDKEITEVTNNQEYIATYTETKNKYNVKFTNYDGSILQEETLEYGTLPVYKGEVPTREKTDEYTYTFKNWNKEITEVTDNEIYIAVYKEEKNKYTVIYMDGEREYTRKEVNYGETVSEEVINKDHNIYRGWTLEENIYDFNTPVTKNITIKSSFELVESPIIESTPIEWTKENVKVTITTNHNDYSYMYKIDDGEYQNYNGEFTVDKNCTVIAKSIKENVESEVTTKEITNIDKVLPEIKEITEENITTKSFDIKVKGQDNESGLSEIRIYKNEELMVSYPYTERLNEEKEETYSLTGLEENTTYKIKVELIDKVGNKNVSEEKEITTLKRVIVSRIIGRNNSLYESEAEYELFESLEEAITACGSNECTIEMVLDTKESVNVLEGQEIKLELNGKTVTGVRDYTIENSGELIIVDKEDSEGGIINNTDTAIKNIENGILQIGENEEPLSVSTTKPNIVGTTYGIYTEEETSKLKFYDGKIEGNVAIQGNVDDTPYLYNAKITNEGHQVATLSILAEAEAKITGGKYYTKLSNAVSETKSGTYEESNKSILSTATSTTQYKFDYDELENTLISNNTKIQSASAYSYIELDLTKYTEKQELTVTGILSTYQNYGYAIVTNNKTTPTYNQTNGRILYMTASNSTITETGKIILEPGKVYYLHIGYAKPYSSATYDNNTDTFKITNITLNDYKPVNLNINYETDLVTPGTYGFVYQDGKLVSNNANQYGTTANSYIKVDLTNYLEDQKIYIYAELSADSDNVGWVTVTDNASVPGSYQTNGRVIYLSGVVISKEYEATLTAGKVNYIHLGYSKYKNYVWNGQTDTFTINGIYSSINRGEFTNPTSKVPVLNEKVDTVELIKDITLTSPIEINETKEMILDLNGYTLTTSSNDYIIKNNGDLTIIDGKYHKDIEKNQADYEAEQAKYDEEYNQYLDAYNKVKEEYEKNLEEYNKAHPNKSFDYTGNVQEYVVPSTGSYRIELWGAGGGEDNYASTLLSNQGRGAYTTGIINLEKGTKIYVYVGQKGASGITNRNTLTSTSYNGGGAGMGSSDGDDGGGAGGGATDIRLVSGSWDDFDSLKSRIMVAGGGAGGSTVSYNFSNISAGSGGLNGVGSSWRYSNIENKNHSFNATQTTGYGLGVGENGITVGNAGGSGAGGGYYGGLKSTDSPSGGAGGGSSYISGYDGCNSLSEESTADNIIHTDQSVHYSGLEFTDSQIIAGNSEMPTHDGSSTMTGNIGNGYARITKTTNESNLKIKNFSYTGEEETYTVPEDGTYKLETWGASGGNGSNNSTGGYGGYSSGRIELKAGDKLYVNVGGQGNSSSGSTGKAGGYNGGASGGSASATSYNGGAGGGGATHIATKSGLLSSLSDSIDSILIVSGGGGGVSGFSNSSGGSGGGISGTVGTAEQSAVSYAGNQTTGYLFGSGGQGRDATRFGNCGAEGNGGGGGGLYGGYSSNNVGDSTDASGGGGSGYIGNSNLTNKAMYCYNCEESSEESAKTISTTNVSETPTKNYAKVGNGYARITLVNKNEEEFNYTGKEEIYTVPKDGTYKLETWGAQGGDIIDPYHGGYGGYSSGYITLNEGDKLYVNVGGKGYSSKTTSSYVKTQGGYNGGGFGYQTTSLYAAGGGGATHIATKSGLLSTLSDSIDSIIIVSGGGAGAYGYSSYFWNGNSGGGVIGGYSNDISSAGTQTKGFAFGQAGDSETTSNWGSSTNRSGGGSGLYGGQSYWGETGAGGGSGYIGNSNLTNKVMYCYDCEESSKESTKTISTTNVSETPIANYAKKGTGYAKITKVNEDEKIITEPVMPEILKDNNVEIKSGNFSYKALNSSSSRMNISDEKVNFYTSWSNTSVTYYTKKVTVEEGQKLHAKGNLGLWHNYNNGSSLGTAYIGFSKTNDISTTDFDSYTTREITSTTEQKDDFDVMISEPGEYYFKIVLYHISYNSNTLYANLYNLLFTSAPQRKYATLKEAVFTGTITSTTNSLIYNNLNANLTVKEAILNLNKSGSAITNDGTVSTLSNVVINLNASGSGIYNGYYANIKDGGATINTNSGDSYGIYNVSKVDDGFSDYILNLKYDSYHPSYGIYNDKNKINVNNIKTNSGYAYYYNSKLIINDSILNSRLNISNGYIMINNSTHKFVDTISVGSKSEFIVNNSTINDSYRISDDSSVTFNNSTIYGTISGGNVEINDSNVSVSGSCYWDYMINSNNVVITGNSTITSEGYGVLTANKVVIGTNDGDVSLFPKLEVKNNDSFVGVKSNDLSIYDGTITAYKANSVRGYIKEIQEGYKIDMSEDNNYESLYLVKDDEEVAQIGDKKYTSLQAALNEVQQNETIKMLKSTYPINEINIDENYNFNIDLNSYNIRAFCENWVLKNSGNLAIINSNDNIKSSIHNSNGKMIENKGILSIKNIDLYSADPGYYHGSNLNNNVIENYATLSIENSDILFSSNNYNFYNYENGEINFVDSSIDGGWHYYGAGSGPKAYTYNKNIMKFDNSTIKGDGTLINDGTTMNFKNSSINISISNNGSITSNDSSVSSINNNKNSSSFVSKKDSIGGIYNIGQVDLYDVTGSGDITNASNALMNIYSGVTKNRIYINDNANLNIYDGTIQSSNYEGTIVNAGTGTVNIYSGNISGSGNYAINNKSTGTINIGTKDGVANKDLPMISSSSTGLYNLSGVVNYYDGTLKGSVAVSGVINNIEDNYDVIKEKQGNYEIKYLGKDYVAQIDSTGEKYYSLQEAINAVSVDGETIKLLRTLTTILSTQTINIPEEKNIILDLNGFMINQSNDVFLKNNGNLTIKDSSDATTDKNGIINYNGNMTTNRGIMIDNVGTLIILSGKITSELSVDKIITNSGTMTIDGGYITSAKTSSNLIENSGNLIINNGYFYGTDGTNNIIHNLQNGILKVNGGTFRFWTGSRNIMMNEGTAYIYDNNVVAEAYWKNSIYLYNSETGNLFIDGLNNISLTSINRLIYNLGTAEISNSTLIGAIDNDKGSMTFSNVIINSSNDDSGIPNRIYNNSTGTITIKNGEYNIPISNKSSGIINIETGTFKKIVSNTNTGSINIETGVFNGKISNTNTGTINLKTGTFTNGVESSGNGIINIGTKGDINDSGELNVSIENPNITGNTYGLAISKGTVNFYDGIISGTTDAVNGAISDIEDGYEIISGTTEDGKKSKYLSRLPVVEVESTGDTYYTLQEAIDSVTKTGETIKLIRNYTTLSTLATTTVPENKNIILDLNGYALEQNNDILLINNGTLKLINSITSSDNKIDMYADKFIINNGIFEADNIKIATNSSFTNIITNKNDLTLNNVQIKSSSMSSNIIENTANMTISDSYIEANVSDSDVNVIKNDNILNITNSSLIISKTANKTVGINNNGTLNLTAFTFSITSNAFDVVGIENKENLVIKDGQYSIYKQYSYPILINNTKDLSISGGTYDVSTDSVLLSNSSKENITIDNIKTINIGTVITNYANNEIKLTNSNISGNVSNNGSGILTLENVTTSNGVSNNNTGVLNINNVIFSSSDNVTYSSITTSQAGTTNINGATITNGYIENGNSHTININDINITTNGTYRSGTIINYGIVNLISGTATSTVGNSITNTGTINIGSKDGNVSTKMPVITGKTYGVSNRDSGKVNFYDGIVSGETGAFYGTINEVEPGYKIVTNKTDTLTSATLTLVGDDEKVAVLNGINFTSLQDAINSASDTNESIITLYKDVTFESNITVPANKNIKLYLNGYTLNKGSYDFTGEGKITVIDGTSTNALANIMESVKEVLNIEGIKKNIIIYEMDDGSAISSESTYKLYKDNEEVILEEDAIGIYSVGNSNDEIRSANNKIYINELPKGKYKLIGDNNKEVKFEIDESGKIIGNVKENTKETRKLVSTAVAELIIMIQTGIEKVNYIMIILTLLVTISSLLYIVKKVNVKES